MYKWLIIGVLLLAISGSAIYYYRSSQATIRDLIEQSTALKDNNKQLITANNANLQTIDNLQASYRQVQQDFDQVQSEFQVIRAHNQELTERLGRHELDVLAAAKPALVQNVINKATQNVARCFELLSGSPLTETEKNAKNEKQFNTECPYLFYKLVTP